MSKITSVEQLQSIYGEPGQASIVKVSDKVTKEYQTFISSPYTRVQLKGDK